MEPFGASGGSTVVGDRPTEHLTMWSDHISEQPSLPTVSNVLAEVGANCNPMLMLGVPSEVQSGITKLWEKFGLLRVYTGATATGLVNLFGCYYTEQKLKNATEGVMAYGLSFLELCARSVELVKRDGFLEDYKGNDLRQVLSDVGLGAVSATVVVHQNVAQLLHGDPAPSNRVFVSQQALEKATEILDGSILSSPPGDIASVNREITKGILALQQAARVGVSQQ